ncbi:tRNA lysidine(34) synthetase TilS [Flavobacterium cheniae]|uniref:tRNA(Ile)-lysidine synthase n=1 Tax=Flavobacterium cheniae TaxID=295428 RepID=A0A562KSG9_9FLAO|nr:tRNA lysidine(34) synthetase TilS [Flavobacterium cheniae]TDR25432.1 tRNA(Ile)-lysidine synthase [Flavobacterium cheniae]TWH98381.1 tRNA(Ile)-lysidine synthase [Flavobacterium cheniae]
MLTKFQHHIEQNFPQLKDKKLLLAVSGGVDSMVLLDLFYKLRFDICIVHCNFQLRGKESDADELLVREICQDGYIPYFIESFDTLEFAKENKLSIQLAARKLRYDWFQEIISLGFDYVLTAHHLDDNVETFLINFTRGTGLEGLTGIPAQNGNIIRPLLPFSREEIENYALENKIQWREDSSNASDKYFRNKLRHNIVPTLKELNTGFLDSFQKTLHHLQQAESLVNDASKLVYEKVVEEKENQLEIHLKPLLEFQNYKAYLYQWLKEFGFSAWNDIYDLVEAQSGKQVFSETHILLKNREKLILSERKEINKSEVFIIESIESKVNIPLKLRFCKAVNIFETHSNCIFVDESKIKFPLTIRKWQEGDYFYPSGMNGKKKLSKYFKDEKYSLLDKENQWLLCSEDQIIWVIGKRADNRFINKETTQNSIKIVLEE